MTRNFSPATDQSPPGRTIWISIICFFLLSYAFTWWGYGLAFLTGVDAWAMMFTFGPIAAGLVWISMTEGRRGLATWYRRAAHLRGPVRYYLAAILVPSAIAVASGLLAILLGADAPAGARWLEGLLPALLLAVPVALLMGPMSEEVAFRGWGQYRLQARTSSLTAAIVIGIGVVGWHLPLFITGDIPWTVAFALPAVSVIYAWLYRQSGTVWTAVALHTMVNVASGIYVGEVFDGDAATLRLGILAAGFIVWAAYIVYRNGPSLAGRGPLSPQPATPMAPVSLPL